MLGKVRLFENDIPRGIHSGEEKNTLGGNPRRQMKPPAVLAIPDCCQIPSEIVCSSYRGIIIANLHEELKQFSPGDIF